MHSVVISAVLMVYLRLKSPIYFLVATILLIGV
jgi:hypothetical protein